MVTPPKKTPKKPGKPGRPAGVDTVAGKHFGWLTIRRKVHTKDGLRIQVECVCGKVFNTRTQYLTRKPNPQVSCGCKNPNTIHAMTKAERRTKVSWSMMHVRCYYEKHVAYKGYGGRGIYVCTRWHRDNPDGWKNFYNDMGPRPSMSMSLDRKDPNGIYEPDNCRWATKTEQTANQRHKWVDGKPPKAANL